MLSRCACSLTCNVLRAGRPSRSERIWQQLSQGLKRPNKRHRKIIAMSYTTHLERTQFIERQQDITSAIVASVNDESPSVKKLMLLVENPTFSFKAGQWVDFFIQGVSTVGGFSMCSAPKSLKEDKTLELAVKYSKHPPAHWIHTKCKVGDKVLLQVGGNFYYAPALEDTRNNLLLIAGGVGINPIFSILKHVQSLNCEGRAREETVPQSKLMFSAKSMDELLFKNEIDDIVKKDSRIYSSYFITGKDRSTSDHQLDSVSPWRISEKEILSSLDELGGVEQTSSFICGPPPMIEEVHATLKKRGLPEHSIHFEKWW